MRRLTPFRALALCGAAGLALLALVSSPGCSQDPSDNPARGSVSIPRNGAGGSGAATKPDAAKPGEGKKGAGRRGAAGRRGDL